MRNRLRRRIYEQVRLHGDAIAPGTDLVFTAYGERLAELPAAELKALVEELLAKIRV